ncbi:MAG: amidase, partial [Pseudorhodobacter sp.]|nr:amidase [Pseudorhodobacter sp.]
VRLLMQPYDLLVTPTLPVASIDVCVDVPPALADRTIVSWATFTYPFSLTGQPAASLPIGMTAAGLPVALQLVANAMGEAAIPSVAGQNDREFGEMRLHPRQPDYL